MSKRPRTKTSPTPGPDVTIDICSGMAVVDPPIPELLPALCYGKLNFEPEAQGGISMRRQRKMCFNFDFRNRIAIGTGLVPRARDFLEALGLKVEVTDHRKFGVEHQPDAEFFARLSPNARSAADAMIRNPLGQIRVDNDAAVSDHLVLAYRLFPAARIAIAVASRKSAWRLWKQLQCVLEEPIGLLCSSSRRSIGRCTVTTFKYLKCIDPGETQILLLPDAREASANNPRGLLARFALDPLRCYAFLSFQSRLDETETLKIEQIAGRLIHSSVPLQRQVRVALADSYSAPQTRGLAGLDRKRAAYWSNVRRNDRVVEAAKSFAAGDATRIWKLGLLLDKDERFFGRGGVRVAVLVESPEHGRRLHRLLPGWRLCMAGCDAMDAPTIMTVAAALSKNHQPPDVLIVASGGNALPQMQLPDAETDALPEIIVVDFADDFDGWASDERKLRLMGYNRRGWKIDQRRQQAKTRRLEAPPTQLRVNKPSAASPIRDMTPPTDIHPVREHQDADSAPPEKSLPRNRSKESRK